MAKKDDNLEAWRLQYPSTTASWKINGDQRVAENLTGVAKNMLYALKNRMRISVPPLKQLQNIHRCDDGSLIIVKSVYGQDFIDITSPVRAEVLCCEEPTYIVPEIDYTALEMICGETQELSAKDGCWPFKWEVISGNGTIEPEEKDSSRAVFTAPDTNPGCPKSTIRLTDACQKTATIDIVVTADVIGVAYSVFEWVFYEAQDRNCVGGGTTTLQSYHIYENQYDFLGNYLQRVCMPPCFPSWRCTPWNPTYCQVFALIGCGEGTSVAPTAGDIWKCIPTTVAYGEGNCSDCPCILADAFGNPSSQQPRSMCFSKKADCPPEYNGFGIDGYNPGYDGEAVDKRTEEMINQGCCPINPETGLPF